MHCYAHSYDYTGWLVEALTANLVDFLPFLFLVFLLVTTFGFIFLLLFTPTIDAARLAALPAYGRLDVSPSSDNEAGFGHVLQASTRAPCGLLASVDRTWRLLSRQD